MTTNEKPLTKALHTTRVVEAIARDLVARTGAEELEMFGTGERAAKLLFTDVLRILGNTIPVDDTLYAQCIAACQKVLS